MYGVKYKSIPMAMQTPNYGLNKKPLNECKSYGGYKIKFENKKYVIK